MSKRYPGGVIRKTPATPTQSSASGVWGMTDVTQAQQTNNWPVANVPNPMSRSLRFRSSASAYLNRTPAVAGNRKIWTFSAWIKRGTFANYEAFFGGVKSSGRDDAIRFSESAGSNQLYILFDEGATGLTTTQVFRDPSAWYHIVVAVDTTQATASNRVKLYVNGSQVTAFATASYPAQNYDCGINNSSLQTIGKRPNGDYFDGYMAEVNFVDGQQLAATDFGQYDQFSNWTSKKYTGTYGTNGFYLPFSNNSSTGTLGLDFSGNNNTWTTNNISLTAGTTYDSMVDVPTQWTPYNVTGDVGGVIRGNYCVWNPLNTGTGTTTTDGNLKSQINTAGGVQSNAYATMEIPSTVKIYAEFLAGDTTNFTGGVGVAPTGYTTSALSTGSSSFYFGGGSNAQIYVNGSLSYDTGATWPAGTVLGIAVDRANSKVWYSKNNTWLGSGTQDPVTNQGGYAIGSTASFFLNTKQNSNFNNITIANFGQYAFTYAPPSGYKSLCTTNLPTPTIQQGNLVMDVTTWSGNGSSPRSITNTAGFKPDLVWSKVRNDTYGHMWFDSVRGAGGNKELGSNSTSAEGYGVSAVYGYTSSFNSNGFTVTAGTDGSNPNAYCNQSGLNYVGWQWQAGQGTNTTNTAGSITSTVSVNATAGFSIVTYTGTGSNATVGHGLGVAPKMIIIKSRSNTSDWIVYNSNLTSASYRLFLNDTSGQDLSTTTFNSTAPTSSVFSIGTNANVNSSGWTQVAYCWSEIAGFSKFGSYTGNGSTNGSFVYTGFRPKFVMIKISSGTADSWFLLDTARDTYNVAGLDLGANLSYLETDDRPVLDFLSNGIKMRCTYNGLNASGSTYIYMAFAEYPFKSALAR